MEVAAPVLAAPAVTTTSGALSAGTSGVASPHSTTGVTEEGALLLSPRVLQDSLLGSRDRVSLVCLISGTEPVDRAGEVPGVTGESEGEKNKTVVIATKTS